MSYLREIMQRLNARSAQRSETPPPEALLSGAHLEHYRQQLEQCCPAMVQYEWAWLEQHIEALELCGSQPEMLSTAGGAARVEALLAESQQCRELVVQRLDALAVEPGRHRHTVVPTEHAWELSHPEIRRQWGIDPARAGDPMDLQGAE
jgi:hypothetical protein